MYFGVKRRNSKSRAIVESYAIMLNRTVIIEQ